ncbi:MAG: CHAD domain-containing protein [Acidobacteriota bacterium]|nr:CHAD domain-containing protein [Acidobacteriota bacterium]
MAYRLIASESVPEGIQRVVREEIRSATETLRKEAKGQRDEAVHEARKSIKKVRGVLRLVKPQLGQTYRQENTRFRDVGRQLSDLRDAAALLEVFDELTEKFKDVLDSKGLKAVRQGLEQDKREIEQHLNAAKVVQRASAILHSAELRLTKWPLREDGFHALAPGLKQTYRRGRRALKLAKKRETPGAYHDFRKRVKDHWYHVRLLEGVWTGVMEAHEKSLKDLETWLGDDHNLVVLREKLEANPDSYGGEAVVPVFLAVVAEHQNQLRENSISLGERVYTERPSVFVHNIGKLWKTWHSQPDAVKDVSRFEPSAPPKVVGREPAAKSQKAG